MPTDRFQYDPTTSGLEKQILHIKNVAKGFARPSRFYFTFAGVASLYNERLMRSCQSTSLPGRALLTQAFKIYGPPKEYAYESNYQNELQMTFRVSTDMFERDFFESWLKTIYSPTTADLQYPDKYRTILKIYQLDTSDKKVYCSELYDVYPKSISDIELGTDLSDQIETVTITLAYSEYQITGKIPWDTAIGGTPYLLARDEVPYFLNQDDVNIPFWLKADDSPQQGPPDPAGIDLGGNARPWLLAAPAALTPISLQAP